jgi:adenosylmethionine-8-amino-7-oxononanoate aminotransferase
LQGAGGMIVHPPEFLQRIAQLCSEYNVLLIADEVLTGFGRCGRMFACESANVVPDIMCVSKGLTGGSLPLGATICSGLIRDSFRVPDRSRTFFHGHSFAGNPIACAAAVASLQVFESEPVFERIVCIEGIHRQRLAILKGHPAVAETRMIGAVGILELQSDSPGYLSEVRDVLYRFYLASGVLLRPLGNVIYVLPPYAITPDQLHFVYDTIEQSLEVALRIRPRDAAVAS